MFTQNALDRYRTYWYLVPGLTLGTALVLLAVRGLA